jgi:hypothetical protein
MGAYEVWLKGFSIEAGDPVPELMRLFGISEERARKLAAAVPVVVKRNTTREKATKFSRSLAKIGAHVEVLASADGETSGFSERPPARTARSVEPSRRRTGRGLERHASSPEMPAFDPQSQSELPRRRESSSAMPAVNEPLPDDDGFRHPSSSGLDALSASAPPPRRHSDHRMPAIPGRGPDPFDADELSVPFLEDDPVDRYDTPSALDRGPAVRPQRRPAVVGSSRSERPPGMEDLDDLGAGIPMASEAPGQFIPAQTGVPSVAPAGLRPDSLKPGGLSGPPPAMSGAPSVAPPPLPSLAPDGLAPEPPPPGDYKPPIALVVVGLLFIVWRIAIDSSMFLGKASWVFGVWVEAAALAGLTAGIMRIVAIRDGRGYEPFISNNRYIIAGAVPLALLINWAVASSRLKPALEGSLDARLEVVNKIADACQRTAKDKGSCDECCEGKMVFTDSCECIVPWHCTEGDTNAEACKACCHEGGGEQMNYQLIHNQGCVCNPDLLYK